ncbi:MAG: hypothetical protein IT462_05795 [Planctomycetes bacterium]|nr:hypothetical protein [Planctomycetota bacterium]
MLTIQFGDESLGPVQSLEIERKAEPEGGIERWRAAVNVGGATAALAEQAAQQLEAQLAGTAALKLVADGADVRTLALADCRRGPALERVEIAARDPAAAHEQRRVVLTFVATLQNADDAVQLHTSTIENVTKAGEATANITRGRIVLCSGESPTAHEGLLPAVAGGYRRVRREVTRDSEEPSLEYVVEDRQVFAALPQGVEDGFYSRAIVSDADGTHETVKGFFVGAAARVRAEELAAQFSASDRRIEENAFTRRVDFEFSAGVGSTADPDVVGLSEQVSFTWKRHVVDHPVLGAGQPHYRQIVGAPWVEVNQSGKAQGRGSHPSAPVPLYADDLIEREVTRSGADETRWRYVFRLLNAQIFQD